MNSTNNNSRGFTLIELLVVVAIIGMLSSVVLASLNTARSNAADSSIKANLVSVATEAELYRSTQSASSPYGPAFNAATCPTSGSSMFYANTTIRSALKNTTDRGGVAVCRATASPGSYAISSSLPGSGSTFCIDHTGYRGPGTVLASGSTTRCVAP